MSFISGALGGQASAPQTLQYSGSNTAQSIANPFAAVTGIPTLTGAPPSAAQIQLNNDVNNQNALIQQLQTQAQGGGPNPAAQQLQNAVAQNAASSNAIAASQRGVNPGLALRTAIESNAQNNQTAAGQAAQAGMQQQLNAQQQLGGELNTQTGQQLQASQANASIQAGVNQSNAANAQSASGGLLGGVGSAFGLAEGGYVPHYDDGGDIPSLPAVSAGPTAKSGGSGGGGGSSPLASLAPLLLAAKGGAVANPFISGASNPFSQSSDDNSDNSSSTPASTTPGTSTSGPQSYLGKFFSGAANKLASIPSSIGSQISKTGNDLQSLFAGTNPATANPANNTEDAMGNSEEAAADQSLTSIMANGGKVTDKHIMAMFAKGGMVPAMVSPGERYLTPSEVKKVEKGEKSPMKAGEKIPGKPKVPGPVNDYANDTVRKKLKEGGVVLPNSVTMSKDAEKKAMAFMAALKSKRKSK